MGLGEECVGTSPAIHLLALLFGMGSDLAVAGIWVELPILVFFLPEGWSLGSYMTIVLQAANISPIIYTLGHIFFPKIVRERPTIYFIATLGSTASLLLAFFWDRTSIIFGNLHSTALFGLHFCLSIMDCTSSIVFITAMGVFNDSYMTTFFLGEGLSGLVPALVALAQGAGDVACSNKTKIVEVEMNGTLVNITESALEPEFIEPNFAVMYFFFCLCAMQVISIICYTLLMYLPMCKKEHLRRNIEIEVPEIELEIPPEGKFSKKRKSVISISSTDGKESSVNAATEKPKLPSVIALKFLPITESPKIARRVINEQDKKTNVPEKIADENKDDDDVEKREKLSPFQYGLMLFLTAWETFLANGFLLSIQSYSTLPYGSEPYHLAVILATASIPLSCVLASFLPVKSKRIVVLFALVGTLISVYILVVALLSPEPFLVGTTVGGALAVIAWVLAIFVLTYSRICGALVLKLHGARGLFWYGFMTQAGSAVGAVVSFLMVNVFHLFNDASACPVA